MRSVWLNRKTYIRSFYIALLAGLLVLGGFGDPVSGQSNGSVQAFTPIYDIQGSEASSPLADARTDTFGIVTGVTPTGFFLQDPVGDQRAGTSDGIFVYTYDSPTVATGDCVAVMDALVSEYYGKTELSRVGNIEESDVCESDVISPVKLPEFHFGTNYADLFERNEGMLVQVNSLDGIVHGPTTRYDSGEAEIVVLPTLLQPAVEGGRILRGSDGSGRPDKQSIADNLQVLSSLAGGSLPDVRVGDRVYSVSGQPLTAIVDYNFGKYQLQLLPGQQLVVERAELQPEVATQTGPGAFSICSYNLHGFGSGTEQYPRPDMYAAALRRHAAVIADSLHGCTIVALQEIGEPEDAATLADYLESEYGLQYSPVALKGPGSYNTEYPLTNAYLVRTETVSVRAAATLQGCSDRDYDVMALDTEPCPDGQYPLFNRPPLVLDVAVSGDWGADYELRLINNHWKSKSGDEEVNEIRRMLQAKHVADISDEWLSGHESRRVVVLGDLNDFRNSAPISVLEHGAEHPLVNPWSALPASDRYTYIFNGISQVLDHVLLSENMMADLAGFDAVHLNSDLAKCEMPASDSAQCQTSDHDILVASIRPGGAASIAVDLGYPGIGVTVTQADGTLVGHAETGSTGEYVIWDLQPGVATIDYQPPEWVTVGPLQDVVVLQAGINSVDKPFVQHDSAARAAEAAVELIDAAVEKR